MDTLKYICVYILLETTLYIRFTINVITFKNNSCTSVITTLALFDYERVNYLTRRATSPPPVVEFVVLTADLRDKLK